MWLASGHAVPGGRLAKILKGGKGGPAEGSLKNDALKAASSATSLWSKLILYIEGGMTSFLSSSAYQRIVSGHKRRLRELGELGSP